jgi:hypothetical protein
MYYLLMYYGCAYVYVCTDEAFRKKTGRTALKSHARANRYNPEKKIHHAKDLNWRVRCKNRLSPIFLKMHVFTLSDNEEFCLHFGAIIDYVRSLDSLISYKWRCLVYSYGGTTGYLRRYPVIAPRHGQHCIIVQNSEN